MNSWVGAGLSPRWSAFYRYDGMECVYRGLKPAPTLVDKQSVDKKSHLTPYPVTLSQYTVASRYSFQHSVRNKSVNFY